VARGSESEPQTKHRAVEGRFRLPPGEQKRCDPDQTPGGQCGIGIGRHRDILRVGESVRLSTDPENAEAVPALNCP